MPSDGGGIEQHVGSLQSGNARAFGIPLVPADKRSDPANTGVESSIAEIPGSKVKLLVVKRVIWNVHLAVKAPELAIDVEDGGGIVVDPGSALFEQRSDQHDMQFLGDIC